MALARRLTLVAVFMGMLVLPASATAKLEFNLPAQIFKVLDDSDKSENDMGRCQAAVFVEFPKIRHAKGYRVVVRRNDLNGRLDDYVAPPFENSGFTLRYPPPPSFGRFFVFAYSAGDGCPAVDARTEGAAEIVSARVSLDKRFEKRFRRVDRPPWKCAYRPGDRTVDLGAGRDPRKIIVRRGGEVTTIEKGSKQPVNLANNRYAGTGTIVKTGPKGIVKIGAFDGSSALVGPDTTVRITGKGFEILEAPRHPRLYRLLKRSGPDLEVRTCSAVSAARG
jgi:hypothetical protein